MILKLFLVELTFCIVANALGKYLLISSDYFQY